jgi:hypothetical protein
LVVNQDSYPIRIRVADTVALMSKSPKREPVPAKDDELSAEDLEQTVGGIIVQDPLTDASSPAAKPEGRFLGNPSELEKASRTYVKQ